MNILLTRWLQNIHALGLEVALIPDPIAGRDRLFMVDPVLGTRRAVRREYRALEEDLAEYLAPAPCDCCGAPLVPLPGLLCARCECTPHGHEPGPHLTT